MIIQMNTVKKKKHRGLVGLTLLGLLASFLVCPQSSNAQSTEVVTGTETTTNYLPNMSQFNTSGATKSQQAGNGCTSTAFCTGGKQGPGGSFTTSFDLQDKMTIDQINRGFTMDYGMDVKSHVSNSRLASCVGGNLMQNSDCRDIFKLTVSLFDTGNVLAHKFEHQVELDFSGTQNYAFQQNIPTNTFTALTGEFDMFGIDAGFGSKFFGPQFSNPTLTTTFDLITLIETEVIDIINHTDIINNEVPENTEIAEIEIEVQTPDGQQMATLELEVNTEMSLELEMSSLDTNTPTEVSIEVAEVNTEIEMEMNNVANDEPTADQPVEPTESGTNNENSSSEGSESTTEGESGTEEGESQGDLNENNSSEESQETETTSNEGGEESDSDAGPNRVSNSRENSSSNEKTSNNKSSPKKVVSKKNSKQKVARKIVKKMGDKGRYDSTNQLKTLVIMNVLSDSKKFLVQPTIPQPTGFFSDKVLTDKQLPENNTAAWLLIGGSNQLHDELVNSQYK